MAGGSSRSGVGILVCEVFIRELLRYLVDERMDGGPNGVGRLAVLVGGVVGWLIC